MFFDRGETVVVAPDRDSHALLALIHQEVHVSAACGGFGSRLAIRAQFPGYLFVPPLICPSKELLRSELSHGFRRF